MLMGYPGGSFVVFLVMVLNLKRYEDNDWYDEI
jgi:hypothetical protein